MQRRNRDGQISPFVTQGTFIFPTHGLAVVVKKNFPIRGFAAHGEIFFTTPAKPFVGKIKCALSDEWGNLPIPISPPHGIFIPMLKEKTSSISLEIP